MRSLTTLRRAKSGPGCGVSGKECLSFIGQLHKTTDIHGTQWPVRLTQSVPVTLARCWIDPGLSAQLRVFHPVTDILVTLQEAVFQRLHPVKRGVLLPFAVIQDGWP